jgi:hypothetical protein
MEPMALTASTVALVATSSQMLSHIGQTIQEIRNSPLMLQQVRNELATLQQNFQLAEDLEQTISTDLSTNPAVSNHLEGLSLPQIKHYIEDLDRSLQVTDDTGPKHQQLSRPALPRFDCIERDLVELKTHLASHTQLLSTYIAALRRVPGREIPECGLCTSEHHEIRERCAANPSPLRNNEPSDMRVREQMPNNTGTIQTVADRVLHRSPPNPSRNTGTIHEIIARMGDPELQFDTVQPSNTYTCYIIGGFVSVMFVASLVLAVWWSATRDDISGGFTLGAYILAAATLPTGLASYSHSFYCRCSTRKRRMKKMAQD